ncbi:MAG: UDP-N-acetylmuramate dehydrogenase [Pseudomonadales bacterium]|nr:UDP-N-acetylmuramate dehydrogenase [Pseudomonadales bacterium]
MKLYRNASLKRFNSLGFDSTAEELIVARSVDELADALDTTEPITILGEGTNVVLKSRLRGRVIRPTMNAIYLAQQMKSSVLVSVGAGVNWHELVRYTLGRGVGGLENLALIPGSVGAAPFQNIGAYGVELDQVCEGVEVFDRERRTVKVLPASACKFTYRNSVFKSSLRDRYVICSVNLRLGNRELLTQYRDVDQLISGRSRTTLTPTTIAETVIRIRRRKLPDPRQIGNVGSFFKNPILSESDFDRLCDKLSIEGHHELQGIKVSAARLIDEAGWKGVVNGDAQVWPRQPLVLVNRGNATAHDILDLATRIADDVHRRFNVKLETEPEILGSF